ncbi:MAG: polysaccharide biosynthesis protein [Leptospiraceae bacterium]|nr:MAG: polysaccharide biosynthesis protein [Leptospiraceae bacterium]
MIQYFIQQLEKFIPIKILRVGFLFLSRSFHSLSSLIFSFIVGRLLTLEEHGLYSQYLARIVVFQAILEVGLQYSMIRYLSPAITKNKINEISYLLRASLRIKFYAILLVLLICLYWMVENFYGNVWNFHTGLFPIIASPFHLTNIWLVFLSAIGMSFFSYFDAILVSHKNYKILTFWIPITGTTRIILLLIFFFWNKGVLQINHVLFCFMAGTFISWIFYFFAFDARIFLLPIQRKRVRYWINRLLKYNQWIMLASFFAILSDWMEILMLKNQSDAGIFNAARIPMQGIVILLTTMQSFIMPTMSQFTTSIEYKNYFKKLYIYIILLILLLIPLIFIGNWFIPFWFGEEYYQSLYVFWIIFPSFLLRILFAPLGTALFTLDQPVLIAIEAALRMMGSFILNFFLIPEYGVMGAAVSSLFSQFLGWFFLIYLFYYYFKFDKFPPFLEKIKAK